MAIGYTNLLEILANAAAESPDTLAYTFLNDDGYQTLNYAELDHKAKAVAASLQQHPCRGERAMLLLPPGLDYIIALFGCLYAGMIPVPAYPPRRNHHAQRLSSIVNNAEAKFILTHQVFAEHCSFAPHLLTLDTLDESLANKYTPVSSKIDDVAFLQYTSGSTSTPKGVMISHRNILTNLEIIQRYFGEKTEKICSWLPPYHDMGLIGGILYPLFSRRPVILMSPTYFLQSPIRWLETLSREKITTSVAPNFAYDLCVKKITAEQIKNLDLSNWHYALNGAEPVRYETIQRFCQTFASVGFNPETMRPVYGLAEATLIVSATQHRLWDNPFIVSKSALEQGKSIPATTKEQQTTVSLISCGQSTINHDIQIVDIQTLQPVSEGTIGEVWVSGPSIALGYWNNSELTESTFKAKIGKDYYLRTGDLGFMSEGELYITGRAKDLIIIHGLNHYPQDIEQTVMQSHSALQPYGTAAFTLDNDNEEQLVIMQEIARTHLNKLDAQSVFDAIRSSILSEHGLQVRSIALFKPHALPKTSSGKIQRWVCKQTFIAGELPVIAQWNKTDKTEGSMTSPIENTPAQSALTRDKVKDWIIQWLAQRSHIASSDIKLTHSLAEFGLDSIIATELAADLQNWLGRQIDPAIILEQRSLDDLIQFLISQDTSTETKPSYTMAPPSLIKHSEHPLGALAKNIYFNVTDGISRDSTIINEKKYINYAGYNYLGMSGDPFVTQAVINAVEEYGTSVSASRIASGQKPLHAQLEHAIADLIGVEDCLVYSSGHATNISIITHLFGPNDLIIHDILCHNSILQGAIFSGATRIAFPHNDCAALEKILQKNRSQYEKVLIVSEGIFSMDGDIPDVPGLVALKKQYAAFLMIDEAHSIGTLGKTGAGIREHFNLKPTDVDIWMGTLSKAFASCGGYIAGSSELIEHLKYNAAGFVYSAGISPANTAAAYAAIQLMKKKPERLATLHKRHSLLLSLLKEAGIPTGDSFNTPIIPIITGDDLAALNLSIALKDHKIFAIPIFYPAVEKGKARVRLFINSLHTESQIIFTAKTIKETYFETLKNTSMVELNTETSDSLETL